MPYNSNKSYGNSVSYSFSSGSSEFSEYTSTSNQMGYSNKTVISYLGNSNINYNTSALSDNVGSGNSLGSNGNYMAGNVSGRGMGKGSGRITGKGGGKGMGAGNGGRGMKKSGGGRGCMKQARINLPNQFKEDQKNKFQSDEVDLAINKTQQTNPYKTQKNHLDIIIEKLEEKNKKEQKKQRDKMLKEQE